jgi:flagellar hook assembly protein FlgD
MEPAYPNPSGARVRFNYGHPNAGRVSLVVYDVLGRRVATLVDRSEEPGWRSIVWDGRDRNGRQVASGTYFARIESGGKVGVRKVVFAR